MGCCLGCVRNNDYVNEFSQNKTPAQAFAPPADEKKMGTICGYLGTTAQAGADRCRYFFALKWGRVLISKNGI